MVESWVLHIFKGSYLDFSHLTNLKIHISLKSKKKKKKYKSSITKGHRIKKKYIFLDGVPLKGYLAS